MNLVPHLLIAASEAGDIAQIDIIRSARGLSGAWQYLMGFVLVLIVLMVLWLLAAGIGRYFIKKEKAAQARAAKLAEEQEQRRRQVVATAAAIVATTSPPDRERIPPEITAVITAAVYAALRTEAYRVVSIRTKPSRWSEEGRRAIFAGRRVR